MNVVYTDRARQAGEDFTRMQDATESLQEVLGASGGVVAAEWDRTEDARHRPLCQLKLSDPWGQVEGRFAPSELQQGGHMRVRLHHLWGDLLQARNHRQLRDLKAIVDTEG